MKTENDGIIAKVDKARLLLAEAKDARDAKQVADLARAAEVYAKRQKLGEECVAYATAIRVDAMTLMGEMLKRADKNAGARGNPGGRGAKIVRDETKPTQPPTLAEQGLEDKNVNQQARVLATLKEKAPALHEKVKAGETTISKARVELKREEKRQEQKAKAEAAPEPTAPTWRIITGDALEELRKLKNGQVRLIFADPPYNIGIDYGGGEKADRLPDHQFRAWVGMWFDECRRVLAPDGTLWVMIGDEYAADFGVELRRCGFTLRNWVIWYETFGVNCSDKFNRTKRHLFYCVVNPKRFVFNADAVSRPSDRQTKYGDARANPAGKLLDDVWLDIPRLVGTAAERIPDFPTQLPLALLRRIVACCSDPGDLVLDPFSGSGTTGAACVELGRQFIGIEQSKQFADLSRLRLKGAPHADVA